MGTCVICKQPAEARLRTVRVRARTAVGSISARISVEDGACCNACRLRAVLDAVAATRESATLEADFDDQSTTSVRVDGTVVMTATTVFDAAREPGRPQIVHVADPEIAAIRARWGADFVVPETTKKKTCACNPVPERIKDVCSGCGGNA